MAFNYWNFLGHEEVDKGCAYCHTQTGYLDFLGDDGSAVGTVDSTIMAVKPPEVIGCDACHSAAAGALDAVTLRSGETVSGLGDQARCIVCHIGYTSKASIEELVGGFADDTVAEGVTFFGLTGLHPGGAAASLIYGKLAGGLHDYDGKEYAEKWEHGGLNSCDSCHDSHTLAVKVDECTACHAGVATVEDIRNVRQDDGANDYDGDGDTTEGVAAEIAGLAELLYKQIQTYATSTDGVDPIVYSAAIYPYYFVDANENGVADPDEANYNIEEHYGTWTPRLARAAFNYKYALDNQGAYAHNPAYMIQILVDSIEDLGGDVSGLVR